jgi:hypothetical protein
METNTSENGRAGGRCEGTDSVIDHCLSKLGNENNKTIRTHRRALLNKN